MTLITLAKEGATRSSKGRHGARIVRTAFHSLDCGSLVSGLGIKLRDRKGAHKIDLGGLKVKDLSIGKVWYQSSYWIG